MINPLFSDSEYCVSSITLIVLVMQLSENTPTAQFQRRLTTFCFHLSPETT